MVIYIMNMQIEKEILFFIEMSKIYYRIEWYKEIEIQ